MNNNRFIKFPKSLKFNYKLGSYQKFLSSYYPKELFYFKGKINLNKFIKSVNEALNYHYLMLCNFKIDEKGSMCLYYDPYKKEHVEKEFLEIEMVNSLMSEFKNTYFPTKFNGLLDDFGFVNDFNEMPFSLNKLTIYNDGFIFSAGASHSFIDQYTICNYLKAISEIYTNNIEKASLSNFYCFGNDNSSLIEPYYFNTNKFINKNIIADNNKCDEYFYNKFGYIHQTKVPEFMESNGIDKYYFNNSIIKLNFNLNQFNKFIKETLSNKNNKITISKNDLIHAILLKSFTFTNYLKDTDQFTLRYISDVRKLLEMDKNYYGAAININKLQLNVGFIRNASLYELAVESYNSIRSISKQDFIENLSWFKLITDQNQDASKYACLPSFFSTSVTNWTAFDFNSIKFSDESKIVATKTKCNAAYGVNMITFETNKSNIKYYTTSISIPTNCIDKVNDFSNKTNLFTVENILINNAKL